MSFARPTLTTATPPTDIVPLTAAAFRTSVATGVELDAAATIGFSHPDGARVGRGGAGRRCRRPRSSCLWSADDTIVTVVPVGHWAADTYHTITVQAGSLAVTGRPLTTPVRSAFLTRGPATAVAAATEVVGKRVGLDTAFTVSFDRAGRPDDASTGAIRLEPAVAGRLTVEAAAEGLPRFTFTPLAALKADTRYRLVVDGVRDEDGVPVDAVSLAVKTVMAPEVVRFRPNGPPAGRGPRDQTSRCASPARWTAPRRRRRSRSLVERQADQGQGHVRRERHRPRLRSREEFRLRHAGRRQRRSTAPERGRGSAPARRADRLPDRAQAGRAGRPSREQFVARAAARRRRCSSGGSTGGGSWASVERYYLGLMNCTRTGGWVDLRRALQQPGRSQRRRRSGSTAASAARSPGRTPRSSRSATTAATSSAATRATASAGPATRATAGPRTSAAARGAPEAPSWAATSSSRARSRTTAATTST